MRNLHYAKSLEEVIIEKAVKWAIVALLVGILLGLRLYSITHECEATVEEPTITVEADAMKKPAPIITIKPERGEYDSK